MILFSKAGRPLEQQPLGHQIGIGTAVGEKVLDFFSKGLCGAKSKIFAVVEKTYRRVDRNW